MGRVLLLLVVLATAICICVCAQSEHGVLEVTVTGAADDGSLQATVLEVMGGDLTVLGAGSGITVVLSGVELPEDDAIPCFVPFLSEFLQGCPRAWVLLTSEPQDEVVWGLVFLQASFETMVNTAVIAAGLARCDEATVPDGTEYVEWFAESELVRLRNSLVIEDVHLGVPEYIRVSNRGPLGVDLDGFVVDKHTQDFRPEPLGDAMLGPGETIALVVYLPRGQSVQLDLGRAYVLDKNEGNAYGQPQLGAEGVTIDLKTAPDGEVVVTFLSTQ
jgi:hypothetical protein